MYKRLTVNQLGVMVFSLVLATPVVKGNQVAAFAVNAPANKMSFYMVNGGQLEQIWRDSVSNNWHNDSPAALANSGNVVLFQPYVAVFPTNAAANRKSIYAITYDGRLAQLWDNTAWHMDYPAENAGRPDLIFKGSVAVFPTDAAANKKSIYAITAEGRLAQTWDDTSWHLDFPAEGAGQPLLRFQPGALAVFPTDAGKNKKSIYALTTDGRLAQMWDDTAWHLDFPAEAAGQPTLRFRDGLAVFAINALTNKKSVYALTTDGRLAEISDLNGWKVTFPAESAGQTTLRFRGDIAVFPTNAAANQKSIYTVTNEPRPRLVQLWNDSAWHLDFPGAPYAPNDYFDNRVAVVPTNAAANKKGIFSMLWSYFGGNPTELWDNTIWNVDVVPWFN